MIGPPGTWRPYSLSKLLLQDIGKIGATGSVARICPRAGTMAPFGNWRNSSGVYELVASTTSSAST
jgi:hypothetical protein